MSSILIVEDEVLTSEYLEFVLQEAGYEAIPAASAEEAIEVLEHRDDVHLVVTDINLPGGSNGLQLAALVRSCWPAINIIVVTGYSTPRSEEIPSGSLFVPKPYSARIMRKGRCRPTFSIRRRRVDGLPPQAHDHVDASDFVTLRRHGDFAECNIGRGDIH